MCIYNVYVYVHKLHLAVSQLDARNTRHFSSGIIFTKRLARQPPTLVQRYMYMCVYTYIHACNAFSTRSFCGFQRSVHARSSHQLEIRDLKNHRAIDHPPFSFRPPRATSRGKIAGGYSNFDGLHPSVSPRFFLHTFTHLFYASSSGSIYVSALENQYGARPTIITKIFFRVKVKGGGEKLFFFREKEPCWLWRRL